MKVLTSNVPTWRPTKAKFIVQKRGAEEASDTAAKRSAAHKRRTANNNKN